MKLKFALLCTFLFAFQVQESNSQECTSINCAQFPNVCEYATCPNYDTARCSQDRRTCAPSFRVGTTQMSEWDCQLPVADRRCLSRSENQNCPADGRDTCKSNDDCSPGTMCCLVGCTHACVPEVNTAPVGVCPAPTSGVCVSNCAQDSDCRADQKCCVASCGRVCSDVLPLPTGTCPDGSNELACNSATICRSQQCDAYPSADCRVNKCGSSCTAEYFYKSGRRVDCRYFGPDGNTCTLNPCDSTTCREYPEADCRPEWGPTCQSKYFVNDQEVDCERRCNSCPRDPCLRQTCAADRSARCEADTCACTFKFVNAQGNDVDCDRPVPCTKPDGSQATIVECNDPCTGATCTAYPGTEAICRPNFCGECSAHFYVNNELVDCNAEICTRPNGLQGVRVQCDTNLCRNARCNAYPNAECRTDNCGTCTAQHYENNNIVNCNAPTCARPDGTVAVRVQCATNPCQNAQCAAFPSATCRSNFCGECSAHFYVNNQEVDCTPRQCNKPDGTSATVVQCATNPCTGATCAAHSSATCRPNYCGECSAHFYVNNALVDCAPRTCTRPDGTRATLVQCVTNPCQGAVCRANRKAKCRPNYCGECSAHFYRNGRIVICDPRCPDGSRPHTCSSSLCNGAVCNAHPSAICSIERCGGCSTKFTVSGQTVNCDVCQNGNTYRVCGGCSSTQTCPGVRNAYCETDNCNNCKAVFYDPITNNPLTSAQCNTPVERPGTCPSGRPINSCWQGCQTDNDCRSTYKCCSYGCGKVCRRPVTRPLCPDGSFSRTCSNFLCSISSCPAYPSATCQTNGCNNCQAEFVDNNRVLTDAECAGATSLQCPSDFNYFYVFSCDNVCSVDSECGPGEKCCYSSSCFTYTCQTGEAATISPVCPFWMPGCGGGGNVFDFNPF